MQEGDRNELSLELSQAMNKWLKNSQRAMVIIDGVVTAVNDNFTCDITVQGVPYTNVPICVKIGSQASIYPVPVENTACLVTWRDGNRGLPQIIDFDQVDKYYIYAQTEIFIKAPNIQFDDGSNGGLPLSPSLVSRLNLIENQQNEILTILKSITVASTPFPFAPLFTAVNNLIPTQESDIANTKITQ